MARAVTEGVFPGAVLALWHQGKTYLEAFGWRSLVPQKETNHEDTLYDLASLTKPLVTTLITLRLIHHGRLALDERPWETLGGPPWFKEVRVFHLLAHQAGFPAHRPYFARLVTYPREKRPFLLTQWILAEPPAYPVGYKEVYSDLGFYLLGRLLEEKTGKGLDQLFFESLKELFEKSPPLLFRPRGQCLRQEIAPTEICPWRGKLLRGEVHDENTWAVGGVAGQAGLFGTAQAVLRLLVLWLEAYRGQSHAFLTPDLVQTFWDWGRPGQRALGFDRPSPQGSSAGEFISPRAVGHLGFTGTSFWIDLERDLIMVLLSNRVHPHRKNEKIRAFRPVIHDLLFQETKGP